MGVPVEHAGMQHVSDDSSDLAPIASSYSVFNFSTSLSSETVPSLGDAQKCRSFIAQASSHAAETRDSEFGTRISKEQINGSFSVNFESGVSPGATTEYNPASLLDMNRSFAAEVVVDMLAIEEKTLAGPGTNIDVVDIVEEKDDSDSETQYLEISSKAKPERCGIGGCLKEKGIKRTQGTLLVSRKVGMGSAASTDDEGEV